jgi:hypothetical protein
MKIWGFPPSAFDPAAPSRFAVRCPDHNELILFNLTFPALTHLAFPQWSLEAEAKDAIYEKCKSCISVRSMTKTRWPEGAEL